jgi:hypothetical protein
VTLNPSTQGSRNRSHSRSRSRATSRVGRGGGGGNPFRFVAGMRDQLHEPPRDVELGGRAKGAPLAIDVHHETRIDGDEALYSVGEMKSKQDREEQTTSTVHFTHAL